MRGYMFRNRWFALLFVALTLAGVTTLVGTEEGHGALQDATDQIAQQKAQAEQLTSATQSTPSTDGSAEEVVLASDEDLIDPAQGEDPTPIDEFAAANPPDPEEVSDDVVIVSREVAGQTTQVQGPPSDGNGPQQASQ